MIVHIQKILCKNLFIEDAILGFEGYPYEYSKEIMEKI